MGSTSLSKGVSSNETHSIPNRQYSVLSKRNSYRTAVLVRIPAMHVRDSMGSPLEEFFLLVFTGFAAQKRVFLLSASDVVSIFHPPATAESDKLYYQISA